MLLGQVKGISHSIGASIGMSAERLVVSEIGVTLPDKNFGDENFGGLPFIFVQRYILHYTRTLTFDDLTDNQLYLPNARGVNEQGSLEAYQRQFVISDLTVEFNQNQKGCCYFWIIWNLVLIRK